MTRVIAHRGASRAWPDNTLAAFAAARALRADGVELDVRATADGCLAVVHDACLADGVAVAATRAADLPDQVPLLGPALVACGGLLVNVEIKNDPAEPGFSLDLADAVVAEVEARDGPVLISSFHLATLDRVRARNERLRTGWLVVVPPEGWAATLVERGHHALHPHQRAVTPELVDTARAAAIELNAWTLDDPRRMLELAALGVDGIVTNVPDVACRVLRP